MDSSFNNDRKNEILLAGLKLFCQKSYEGTTIDDITKKAKCSHGLFYHYFKSKKHLYTEIINKKRNDFDEQMSKSLENISDYRDKLRFLINKIFYNLKRDDSFAYHYFFFISHCFTNRDKPRKHIKTQQTSSPPPHIFMENLFSMGQKANQFTDKYSPRECSKLLFSIIQGITLGYVISPKEVRLNKQFPSIDFIIDIFNKETTNG